MTAFIQNYEAAEKPWAWHPCTLWWTSWSRWRSRSLESVEKQVAWRLHLIWSSEEGHRFSVAGMIHVRWEWMTSCHERWLLVKHGFTTLSQKQNDNRWCGITWAAYARGGFEQLHQRKKWWKLSSGIWKEQPSLPRYTVTLRWLESQMYWARIWKENGRCPSPPWENKTSHQSTNNGSHHKNCTGLCCPIHYTAQIWYCQTSYVWSKEDRCSQTSSEKMTHIDFKGNIYHHLTSKWGKAIEKGRMLKESVCKWSMKYMSSFRQLPVRNESVEKNFRVILIHQASRSDTQLTWNHSNVGLETVVWIYNVWFTQPLA